MKYYIQISLLLLFCSIQNISSHNLRQISNRDGLSNSSVTCLFQDEKRFLWIGTYDGLNMYDSQKYMSISQISIIKIAFQAMSSEKS